MDPKISSLPLCEIPDVFTEYALLIGEIAPE